MAPDATAPPNTKENPRTSRVRGIVLEAGVEILLDQGASEVTATRIAEQTGVARTTIYRHYPDQASLVLATIEALVSPGRPAPPTTGDIEADLTTALSGLRARLSQRQVLPVFGALLERASHDDAFIPAQRRFVQALVAPTTTILEEAQERGDLGGDLDCVRAASMLVAPLLQAHLLELEKIDDSLIAQAVAQFLQLHLTGD